MNSLRKFLLALYGFSLRLYPRTFRERYAAEMAETARLQMAESPSTLRFAAGLFRDAIGSLLREHVRAAFPSNPRTVRGLALFFIAYTLTLFMAYVTGQQILRRGADRQPQVLASLVQSQPQSASLAATLAGPRHDLASRAWLHSSTPFVALYDAAGNALAANAVLHGALPQPPHGIFRTIRRRGEYKVTWQPQPGIRVALTGRPLSGGGFVLAGQSLQRSESLDSYFSRSLLIVWVCQGIGCFLFLRHPQRRRVL